MPLNRKVETRRVKASTLVPNPSNWRSHPQAQRDHMAAIWEQVGDVDYLKVVDTDQGLMLIDGHLRADLAADESVDVVVLDLTDEEQAIVLSTFDPLAMLAHAEDDVLNALVNQIGDGEQVVTGIFASLSESASMLAGILDADTPPTLKPADVIESGKALARTLPVDAVFTGMVQPICCIAAVSGMKYGFSSFNIPTGTVEERICRNVERFNGAHDITFVDNEYFQYDHKHHVSIVAACKPKYATVMDVMTEEQCDADGIEYRSFSQIMEWADEIADHAENVIVIPKYDCLDQIPERFVLGYSIPTSHGGTPVPLEAFKGRRVHLLGGSWKWQRNAVLQLGDSIVSLDNNYLNYHSNYGEFSFPDGHVQDINSLDVGSWITAPRLLAMMLSFNAIAYELDRILRGANDDTERRTNDDSESELFGDNGLNGV